MLKLFTGLALLVMVGCGPLQRPMVQRLDADQQKAVDECWNNIMPRQRSLDRQALLDVMITYYLPLVGIDNAQYHAEKTVGDKLVTFDVIFDKARPHRDSFTVTFHNAQGTIVRQEKFSRAEVDQTCADLGETISPAKPDAAETAAIRHRIQARRAAVTAATQPLAPRK